MGNHHTQDTFVLGMEDSINTKVLDIVKVERDSPSSVKKDFYQAGNFITYIGQIVDEHQLEPVLRSRFIALRNRKNPTALGTTLVLEVAHLIRTLQGKLSSKNRTRRKR